MKMKITNERRGKVEWTKFRKKVLEGMVRTFEA